MKLSQKPGKINHTGARTEVVDLNLLKQKLNLGLLSPKKHSRAYLSHQ